MTVGKTSAAQFLIAVLFSVVTLDAGIRSLVTVDTCRLEVRADTANDPVTYQGRCVPAGPFCNTVDHFWCTTVHITQGPLEYWYCYCDDLQGGGRNPNEENCNGVLWCNSGEWSIRCSTRLSICPYTCPDQELPTSETWVPACWCSS